MERVRLENKPERIGHLHARRPFTHLLAAALAAGLFTAGVDRSQAADVTSTWLGASDN